MNTFPTKLAEAFSATIIMVYFENSVVPYITNTDYEGDIKDKGSIVNIPTVAGVTVKTYTGADMTADDLTESSGQLVTDQAKAYYFQVKDYSILRSYIKKPEGSILDQMVGILHQTVDAYVLGLYTKAGAGNRVGTDYVTGTVTITTVTGAVVGSGTTFTSAMVGRGFKAVGHTQWYRVLSYTDATHITIGNDVDDVTAFYDGGTITGAAYTIEAVTGLQVTKSNIYRNILALGTRLNQKFVPKNNRWIVLPSALADILKQAPEYIPSGVPAAYQDVTLDSFVVRIAGFDVFQNEQVAGDSTNGYHILAGHKSAICFAMSLVKTEVEPWLKGNFGVAYKGLNVYGAKVVDERRKALAEGFFIPTAS